MPDETENRIRERVFARLLRHGAKQVDTQEMFDESVLVSRAGPNDELSETCVEVAEFIAAAGRNSHSAIRVIERIRLSPEHNDPDLFAALKKYVEDTGQAIKEADDRLKSDGSSLALLLYEIPDSSPDEAEASWRNLIGRRDVIAHKLLSVDDLRVFDECVRDFVTINGFLSNVHFAVAKSDVENGYFGPEIAIKTDTMNSLKPTREGQKPTINDSVVVVFEDKQLGFWSLRFSLSADRELLIASSIPNLNLPMTVAAVKSTPQSGTNTVATAACSPKSTAR